MAFLKPITTYLMVEAMDGPRTFFLSICRFPKIRGTLFVGPYNKDYTILGYILGSPFFGKLPFGVVFEMAEAHLLHSREDLLQEVWCRHFVMASDMAPCTPRKTSDLIKPIRSMRTSNRRSYHFSIFCWRILESPGNRVNAFGRTGGESFKST